MQAAQPPMMEGHLGPFPIKGTLTAEQRQRIKQATGCSAAIRERTQWGLRMLTVTGPVEKLQEAHRLATLAVEENGEDGGRVPEPKQPPPAKKQWQDKGWSDWRRQDWPTREEVEDLQRRLHAAEQAAANKEWRLQALEHWYWWCNSGSSGSGDAAPKQAARWAEQEPSQKGKRPRRKRLSPENSRGASEATRLPASETESSEATVLPAGPALSPVMEEIKKKRKNYRKKHDAREEPQAAEAPRTSWKPKHRAHSQASHR